MIYVNSPTEQRAKFVAGYRDADISATGEDRDDALRALAKVLSDRIKSIDNEPATNEAWIEREKLINARRMTIRWYLENGDAGR